MIDTSPDIHEKLGALIARMDVAAKALETGSRRFRAGEKRTARLEDALVGVVHEVRDIAGAVRGMVDRQDGQERRLASIDEALVFVRGGWKGAAVVGALLVGAGGLASAIAAFLRQLGGEP